MAAPVPRPAPAHRRPSPRDLRWASGLVLLAYVALHLANHALGLVSLGAAEAARDRIHGFWHGAAGSALLYGAAGLHVALAFRGAWERRSLRMPPVEAVRIALGFALPALLAGHLAAMRGAYEAFGADATYARAVRGLWSPGAAAFQLGLMAAAWAHGCLGVHLAFRARAAWRALLPALLGFALLLPAFAGLGFLAMGREIGWTGAGAGAAALSAAQSEAVRQAARAAAQGYAALVALLLAARALRDRLRRRRPGGTVALRYPDRTVRMPRGATVLEASRAHGIAHLSVCGGRARCSTCRVRVRGPADALPPPGADEARTLERVRAPAGVRLACQLRPRGDVAVAPLFRPGVREAAGRDGRERDVAVLFVDLRRWSGLSERQWPFDLVYTLDRYFETVGAAVRECGGTANQFVGDSVMAIFGLDCALPLACRRALDAADLVARRMDAWNAGFEDAFGQPLEFGMGLHAGRTVVAEVGWEDRTSISAVGEVANTASRLQDHSKASGARLVASRFAVGQAEAAGWTGAPGRAERVEVRGRSAPIDVLHLALPHPPAAGRGTPVRRPSPPGR